ncbi:two-component system sensor histidine kinase/response regulator hybrid [Limnospira maxima CS-328]|uniref:Two-component system sensor histidine kinase/response regulator hybrid n=3 Tax=Sirenicapillariaceae TaxID=2934961 RepID=B5W7J2_LIMMA|nr:two-component system sensor histidine kinase/response regulator hybrid [Limnospira maxima CS-328]UWU49382.1 hypothetical protein APLC1_4230 [Arthrospira platensis C1]
MGSEMEIFSEVGNGTTFQFKLNVLVREHHPRDNGAKTYQNYQPKLDDYPRVNNRRGQHLILMVEENYYNRQLLHQILSPHFGINASGGYST